MPWVILFEASTRQDDPENGKETWIGSTLRQLQSDIAQHVKNERSDP